MNGCFRHCARHPGSGRRRRPFTLVELLVAMAVLVLLMYMLFRFISSAQTAWSLTNTSTEVYEKARIAFDLITRDLECAVARDDTEGKAIYFRRDLSPLGMVFVSCTRTSAEARSDFAEVAYEYRNSDYTFRRACTDTDVSMASIYTSSRDGGDGYHKVIGGVLDMKIDYYPVSLSATWSGTDEETTVLPFAVRVKMKIMDDQSFRKWVNMPPGSARDEVEQQAAREFTKLVFLGNRELPTPP